MKLIRYMSVLERKYKQVFKTLVGTIIIISISFTFSKCKKDEQGVAIVWVLINNTPIEGASVKTIPPNGSSCEFLIEKTTDKNGRVYFEYEKSFHQDNVALILPIQVTKKINNVTYQGTGHIFFENNEIHEEIIRLK